MTEIHTVQQVTSLVTPERYLYACVDTLKIVFLPEGLLSSCGANIHYSQLSDDVFLGEGVVPHPGMYRKVDGRFLGWMEWQIHSAKQSLADPAEVTKADEFVKLLKSLTGVESVAVDISYRKPYNEFAWVDELFPAGKP